MQIKRFQGEKEIFANKSATVSKLAKEVFNYTDVTQEVVGVRNASPI